MTNLLLNGSSDLYWLEKIAAFLHDPPSKVFAIQRTSGSGGHEEVARELRKALLGEDLFTKGKTYRLQLADRLASSIERPWVIRNLPSISSEVIIPLKGKADKRFVSRILTYQAQDEFRKVNAEERELIGEVKDRFLKDDKKNYKEAFLYLWNELNEEKLVRRLSADTRLPIGSIVAHNSLVSAFYSSIEEDEAGKYRAPVLARFTFGPVQGFISQARKLSDLWAGSYMLSWFTWKALERIIEELGPDHVIYPYFAGHPFYKKFILGEENSPDEFNLKVASFPNTILFISPQREIEGILKSMERALREEWKRILKETKEFLIGKVLALLEGGDLIISDIEKAFESASDYFEIFYSYIHWWEGSIGVSPELDSVENRLTSLGEILGEDNEGFEIFGSFLKLYKEQRDRITFYKPHYNFYYLYLLLTEKLVAVRKSIRDQGIRNLWAEGACALCGELPPIKLGRNFEESKKNWKKLSERVFRYVRENEQLCPVCLSKRLFPRYVAEKLDKGKEKIEKFESYPTLGDVAASKFVKCNSNKINKWNTKVEEINAKLWESAYRLSSTDYIPSPGDLLILVGRDAGVDALNREYMEVDYKLNPEGYQALRTAFKELFSEDNVKPYIAIIVADGDNMGKWLSGKFNITYGELYDIFFEVLRDTKLKERISILEPYKDIKIPMYPFLNAWISHCLSSFSYEASKMVRDLGALPVYLGGDDVMLVSHASDVFNIVENLNVLYSNEFTPRASISFGIAIGHYKTPLRYMLEQARVAEREAKKVFAFRGPNDSKPDDETPEKGGLCIRFIKRTGEVLEVGFNLKDEKGVRALKAFESLSKMVARNSLSQRLFYDTVKFINQYPDDELLTSILRLLFSRISWKSEGDRNIAELYIKNIRDYCRTIVVSGESKYFTYLANSLEAIPFFATRCLERRA